MRNRIGVPRFMSNGQVFSIIVILVLAWLAFRGCELPAVTPEQRAQEQATLEEKQARRDEQRQERERRASFDLALYILVRLAALALFIGAGVGLISTLTLFGWRKAATVSPVGGLYPLIISKLNGTWRVFDANRSPVASAELSQSLCAPGWEIAQLATTAGAQQVQVEQARAYNQATANAAPALAPAESTAQDVIMNWPGRVPLTRYLAAQGGASLDRVFLGVTCDPATGQQVPVSMEMLDLVHFAVAGSSGFGKTTFVESLLYQFVKSGACDLAVVDLKGELTPWGKADALRWPIATTRQEGSAVLTACYEELQARKEAFESLGGCKGLADYNARANGNALRPLCAILDEGTVLLRQDRELSSQAVDLVLLGRSFGLWLVLAAQNFKVNSTASEIRDQLTTRVQFHAADGNQARILLGHDRATGLGKGRAIARLSGYESDIELQAPVVTRQEIDALLAGQAGPREPAPVVDVTPATPPNSITPEQRQRILDLHAQGVSKRKIQLEVLGYEGGAAYRAVSDVLDNTTTTN
jgi:hypothetical protein